MCAAGTPEERFDSVVAALLEYPNVTPPLASAQREFGSNALKVNNKIFSMLVRGALVVKLPAPRVTALIDSGAGEPFDAGKGKPMKEWLSVPASSSLDWLALSKEALEFVARRR
jgi:hypothetical protein